MQRTEKLTNRITAGIIIVSVLLFVGFILGKTNKTAAESTPVSVPSVSKYDEGPPDATEILELVNAERATYSVAPLKVDDRLNKSAQLKANDMLERGYFEHADPQGKRGAEYVFEQSGNLCTFAGENLSKSETLGVSRDSVNGWISSPAHYGAMIDGKYTLTGIGIAGTYVVQHFCVES